MFLQAGADGRAGHKRSGAGGRLITMSGDEARSREPYKDAKTPWMHTLSLCRQSTGYKTIDSARVKIRTLPSIDRLQND